MPSLARYEAARDFAQALHGDQKRKYTGEPYVVAHPREVALPSVSSWRHAGDRSRPHAHDVVEDTPTTQDEVARGVRSVVADLVAELTDQIRSHSAQPEKCASGRNRTGWRLFARRSDHQARRHHQQHALNCRYDPGFARLSRGDALSRRPPDAGRCDAAREGPRDGLCLKRKMAPPPRRAAAPRCREETPLRARQPPRSPYRAPDVSAPISVSRPCRRSACRHHRSRTARWPEVGDRHHKLDRGRCTSTSRNSLPARHGDRCRGRRQLDFDVHRLRIVRRAVVDFLHVEHCLDRHPVFSLCDARKPPGAGWAISSSERPARCRTQSPDPVG